MEKSEMRKLAEFIEKLSWDDLPEEVKTTVSFRVLDLISAALGAVDDPLVKKVKASYLERNNGTGGKIWVKRRRNGYFYSCLYKCHAGPYSGTG